ncbi:uncharacterized protein BO87DRAFT_399746 [Aspergillus neoniger CBS 115656]|uniref:Uncharacterized protein n=1 Tax=Aspergillus neoniger (strain CBS 115656) TaxID=1448310 RepID=A0A318Z1S5_ASPNB|nr:hypothetical protein BO87DRAFT_399746 [Aspergillus neoniger CBS 115656]PYH31032.1 hypothetical protein BO87DRAFT_399746 [Aspergillus neoniger CBS 115656]
MTAHYLILQILRIITAAYNILSCFLVLHILDLHLSCLPVMISNYKILFPPQELTVYKHQIIPAWHGSITGHVLLRDGNYHWKIDGVWQVEWDRTNGMQAENYMDLEIFKSIWPSNQGEKTWPIKWRSWPLQ